MGVQNQATFEQVFCNYASEFSATCNRQQSCRTVAVDERSLRHASVKISEAARKADYSAGKHVLCLFKIFEKDNMDKPGTLDQCTKNTQSIDTSALDISYHPVPAEQACTPEPDQPGASTFTQREYSSQTWYTIAPAADSNSCPTLPPPASAISAPQG